VGAPTNKNGDSQTSRLDGDKVKTPDGFKDAYKQFADGGWNAFVCAPAHGGQGLPWSLGMAV
ncbi:MAG TPA: acyl-CoA dehydrogenase, partial [Rhodospirillaceae bacterium]|nr:acyl-CoA dehydrogenase [Rhodospirillaceae bacterium]